MSCEQTGSDAVIRLDAHPDGHLTLVVNRLDGSLFREADFQRVLFVGNGYFLINAEWSVAAVTLRFNGKELGGYAPESAPLEVVTGAHTPGVLSTDHPDASSVCRGWVLKRQKKFAGSNPRANRRAKTPGEEATDLWVAVRNLRGLELGVRSGGHGHLIGYLAAELRALVYWQADEKREAGYNPLLLRMASKADLPLPVFGFENLGDSGPPIPRGATFHAQFLGASLVQQSPAQKLMDLQEWLGKVVTILRDPAAAPGSTVVKLSTKSLVSETANALGAAHYDEDVSVVVSLLREAAFSQADLLTHFMCGVAVMTADLGEWVLSSLDARGVISLADVKPPKPS